MDLCLITFRNHHIAPASGTPLEPDFYILISITVAAEVENNEIMLVDSLSFGILVGIVLTRSSDFARFTWICWDLEAFSPVIQSCLVSCSLVCSEVKLRDLGLVLLCSILGSISFFHHFIHWCNFSVSKIFDFSRGSHAWKPVAILVNSLDKSYNSLDSIGFCWVVYL